MVFNPTLYTGLRNPKRIYWQQCQIKGLAVHSSLAAEGCNAIDYAGRLICYLHKLANDIKENGPFDKDFDCPFTTISANIISGGIASNIAPGNCEPTVVCGPGDIEQAHRSNEFVSIEQLNLCEKVLSNIVNLFCLNLGNET